jgi:hypothetical protein
MRVKKDRPSARDVPHIFSNQCIEKLVAETGLPLDPGRLPGFATSIRTRALIYIRDKGTPSDADVAREVAELYWAADRHQHAKATKLVRNMSKRTRDFLKKRATMPSVALTIPKPSAFLDSARRQAACETLRRICSRGGAWDDNGRWVPLLLMPTRPITRNLVEETKKENTIRTHMGLAPIKIARPPKRQAARDFIMWMQAMYLSAGRRPPTSARKYEQTTNDRTLQPGGPFVRLMQRCLDLLGAEKADATGAINELRKQAKTLASRQNKQKPND